MVWLKLYESHRTSYLLFFCLAAYIIIYLAYSADMANAVPSLRFNLKPFNQSNVGQRQFVIAIDGIIFQLQGGHPKGISTVWRHLIPELARNFPAPNNRVIFFDAVPQLQICMDIVKDASKYASFEHRPYAGGNLDAEVKSTLLRDEFLDHTLVFLSTYMQYPWKYKKHLCQILMYHDLIPEMVGMNHGPGTEYYPRIEALPKINSIVSVSYSTSNDIVRVYGDKVKNDGILLSGFDNDTYVQTRGTIIQTIPNRISRDVFPGVASPTKIVEFKQKFKLFGDATGNNDYFVTVGSSHPYKNRDTVFKAIGQLSDEILSRYSFVMTGGATSLSQDEMNALSHRTVIIRTDTTENVLNPEKLGSAVRLRIIGYLPEEYLHVAYSGATALIYVSSYEGFGLPIVEALTSGTLAIASNASSMPEVGGKYSLYVNNPRNATELTERMSQVVGMSQKERRMRIFKGRKHVEQYGGGGKGGLGHGWDEMGRLLSNHIRGSKHRGTQCYLTYGMTL